jgi:ribosomal protein S18 acetylase RimI-like enzyme
MPKDPALLNQLMEAVHERGKVPAFYVPVVEQTRKLRRHLHTNGLAVAWTDSWLVVTPSQVEARVMTAMQAHPAVASIRTVKTRADLKTFLSVLRNSRAEPVSWENPYGPLSDQELTATSLAVERLMQYGIGQCFIVEKSSAGAKQPIAVAVVTLLGGIAHISSVGTLPAERRQGFGTAATLAAAAAGAVVRHVAELLGTNPVICLATAPGQGPDRFFRGLGFEPLFIAEGFRERRP